ncbi:hypothetical protein T07_1501 [Trichinella nelsoni]|uniref:Uncharacterized protein n=1 Tax=Trichinella nelsoni TaxID=6336 RepID=A0A0V0SJS3_9BILA|nr:hypothetical protein T07_1501 [Trichinella nelsoni]
MNIDNEKTTHLTRFLPVSLNCNREEFILSEKFQCTKTGFQRSVMQITIAIKGALSSVRAHLFAKLMKQRKSENADDTKQITDATKKNNRKQQLSRPAVACFD